MTSTSIYSTEIILTQSKLCSKCNTIKPLLYFSKSKRDKDGHQSQCKACIKEYHQINKESIKEYRRQYRHTNRERDKEHIKEYSKEYAKTNKAVYAARSAKRRALKISATPKWAELDLINNVYIECKVLSESLGIIHNVDHIVPLDSKIVCGLHCFANLRIITEFENKSKSNSYWPDMP